MLPEVSDDDLLGELGKVVEMGWALPERGHRAAEVRHLLLMVDRESALTYAESSSIFLRMLDEALVPDVIGEDEPTQDQALGLRILLGTHPEYRYASAPMRRENAAEYLWPDNRSAQVASSFHRRRERAALRLALDCLRAVYGQGDDPYERDHDLLAATRAYVVDEHGNLCYQGEELLVRARRDMPGFSLDESIHEDTGFERSEIRSRDCGDDTPFTFVGERQINGTKRKLEFAADKPITVGQTFRFAWEEAIHFRSRTVARAARYYVSFQAPNDRFELTIEVRFLGELPRSVWWFRFNPGVDPTDYAPHLERRLEVSDGVAAFTWNETQRRMCYGIQWDWEQGWPKS